MDIYASPGTLVRMTKESERDAIYTVARTKVGSWHTDVYLVERPGIAFNSVDFDEISASSRLELLVKYGIYVTSEQWQEIKKKMK